MSRAYRIGARRGRRLASGGCSSGDLALRRRRPGLGFPLPESAAAEGAATPEHVVDQTFLRGTQESNVDGLVEFHTIYPGWYPGRAVRHIHVTAQPMGRMFTSQLVLSRSADRRSVHARSVLRARACRDTTNAADAIFPVGGQPAVLDVVATHVWIRGRGASAPTDRGVKGDVPSLRCGDGFGITRPTLVAPRFSTTVERTGATTRRRRRFDDAGRSRTEQHSLHARASVRRHRDDLGRSFVEVESDTARGADRITQDLTVSLRRVISPVLHEFVDVAVGVAMRPVAKGCPLGSDRRWCVLDDREDREGHIQCVCPRCGQRQYFFRGVGPVDARHDPWHGEWLGPAAWPGCPSGVVGHRAEGDDRVR